MLWRTLVSIFNIWEMFRFYCHFMWLSIEIYHPPISWPPLHKRFYSVKYPITFPVWFITIHTRKIVILWMIVFTSFWRLRNWLISSVCWGGAFRTFIFSSFYHYILVTIFSTVYALNCPKFFYFHFLKSWKYNHASC